MEILLKQSVNEGLMLEMIYESSNGVISQRMIRVKSVNNQHFIAYCYYRKQTRMFRRDRILSLFAFNRHRASNLVK